jgi:competence protein ComEA
MYYLPMGMTTGFGRLGGTAVLRGAACVLILAGAHPASAQIGLPDGPGKDQLIKVCGLCHEPQRAASIRLTRDGWEATINDMIARGARGTDEEFQAVLDYLSTHFLGEAPRPLNVNTAQAIDFETVLLLLRKEAAAVIAYREKHGLFKTVEDLKKVPGVDVKKIETQKDRLYFGGVVPSAPKNPE